MPGATLFPDTRGPRAGVRRAVDARNRARGGAARSVDAVASRVAVARAVASPRVPGFAFVRGWEGARTRERRLHRHLGGRLGGEERAASGDGALARRGATHARGGDAAASARHREAGHGHAERGGHRRRPVRMEWPARARSGTKTPKPRARDEARHVARWCRSRIGFDTSKALFFFFFSSRDVRRVTGAFRSSRSRVTTRRFRPCRGKSASALASNGKPFRSRDAKLLFVRDGEAVSDARPGSREPFTHTYPTLPTYLRRWLPSPPPPSPRCAPCAARRFAGSKAAFAAPARATVSSRASLKVQAANRELWCV